MPVICFFVPLLTQIYTGSHNCYWEKDIYTSGHNGQKLKPIWKCLMMHLHQWPLDSSISPFDRDPFKISIKLKSKYIFHKALRVFFRWHRWFVIWKKGFGVKLAFNPFTPDCFCLVFTPFIYRPITLSLHILTIFTVIIWYLSGTVHLQNSFYGKVDCSWLFGFLNVCSQVFSTMGNIQYEWMRR